MSVLDVKGLELCQDNKNNEQLEFFSLYFSGNSEFVERCENFMNETLANPVVRC
jgi:hypothetical protein